MVRHSMGWKNKQMTIDLNRDQVWDIPGVVTFDPLIGIEHLSNK